MNFLKQLHQWMLENKVSRIEIGDTALVTIGSIRIKLGINFP